MSDLVGNPEDRFSRVAARLYSGPAGTGKTESVNALNNQLGKFILVFNPDNVINKV